MSRVWYIRKVDISSSWLISFNELAPLFPQLFKIDSHSYLIIGISLHVSFNLGHTCTNRFQIVAIYRTSDNWGAILPINCHRNVLYAQRIKDTSHVNWAYFFFYFVIKIREFLQKRRLLFFDVLHFLFDFRLNLEVNEPLKLAAIDERCFREFIFWS